MVAGRVASMGLGFLFWLLAARFFPASTVGLASGAVAAMMLCTQLALFGFGSAFIAQFPKYREQPSVLLDNAITAVTVASFVVGCLFLTLAALAFDELGTVVESLPFAILFVVMCVLGTLNILLDQVSIAMGRGRQVLSRNLAFGGAAVAAAVVLGLTRRAASPAEVFLPWVLAGICACWVGVRQLASGVPGYRYRPRCDVDLGRRLAVIGFPNHLLTLTERAPGLVLPIVVTELLSPADNAYWYAVWMMAWVVCIVPLSVGLALFAEVAKADEKLTEKVTLAVRISLGIGVLSAVAVAATGPLTLHLLGADYAAAGTTPLRILVLAVIPMTAVQVYSAVCRGAGRLGEAIATGATGGALAIGAASVVARPFGLVGMAWAWVAVQSLLGIWAVSRVRVIGARERVGHRDLAPSAPPVPYAS